MDNRLNRCTSCNITDNFSATRSTDDLSTCLVCKRNILNIYSNSYSIKKHNYQLFISLQMTKIQ